MARHNQPIFNQSLRLILPFAVAVMVAVVVAVVVVVVVVVRRVVGATAKVIADSGVTARKSISDFSFFFFRNCLERRGENGLQLMR